MSSDLPVQLARPSILRTRRSDLRPGSFRNAALFALTLLLGVGRPGTRLLDFWETPPDPLDPSLPFARASPNRLALLAPSLLV